VDATGPGHALRFAWLIAFVAVAAAVPAQEPGSQELTGTLPFIVPFDGGVSGSNTEVRDLRVRFHIPIVPLENRSWGLRLRVTLYAGIYDVALFDEFDFDDISFQSLGATPGVELLLPVGPRWTLKPFADIGYARDFENELDLLLWSVGMRTLGCYEVGQFDLSVGTKVQWFSVHTSNLDLEDRLGELMLGFDATRPVPLHLGKHQAELSGYYIYRYFYDARIERDEGDPLTLEASHEIGIRFGTEPRIKLWFIRLPSIGLGYRWGENLRGVRLNFGFPF
jgi:hypothetical protein